MSQIARGVLSFTLELTDCPRADVTAYAGLPLVLEQARIALRPKAYRKLRDALGYRNSATVRRHLQSALALFCAGGDHIEDLCTLRADQGLRKLIGFELSSPTQLKEFLYRFHQDTDGAPLSPEQDAELSQAGKAQIRPEGPGLRNLCTLLSAVVERLQKLQPRGPPRNNCCIRRPIHPGRLRRSSVKYVTVFALLAPCQPGASAASVRHTYFAADPGIGPRSMLTRQSSRPTNAMPCSRTRARAATSPRWPGGPSSGPGSATSFATATCRHSSKPAPSCRRPSPRCPQTSRTDACGLTVPFTTKPL
jgi:hypothetical protein